MLEIQTPEAVMFWVLAPLSVIAALGMLLVKKAVHSAILLAWVMIILAIFYIAQDAVFPAILQDCNKAVSFLYDNATKYLHRQK